jgi:hypothetical protein
MKDYLEDKGFAFKPAPKDTFRLAQQSKFIDYAQELIDGMEMRNELSHDYSGVKFGSFEQQMRDKTFVALQKLYALFSTEMG